MLAPRPPFYDRGRRGLGGDGRSNGGQMPHVADRAAVVGASVSVIVRVNGDRGSGLKSRKANQQKQDQGGAQPADGNAAWISPEQRDPLSVLDGPARRRFHRTASVSARTVKLASGRTEDPDPGKVGIQKMFQMAPRSARILSATSLIFA